MLGWFTSHVCVKIYVAIQGALKRGSFCGRCTVSPECMWQCGQSRAIPRYQKHPSACSSGKGYGFTSTVRRLYSGDGGTQHAALLTMRSLKQELHEPSCSRSEQTVKNLNTNWERRMGHSGFSLIFFLTVVHRSPRGVLSLTHDDRVPPGNRFKGRLAVEDDAQGSS